MRWYDGVLSVSICFSIVACSGKSGSGDHATGEQPDSTALVGTNNNVGQPNGGNPGSAESPVHDGNSNPPIVGNSNQPMGSAVVSVAKPVACRADFAIRCADNQKQIDQAQSDLTTITATHDNNKIYQAQIQLNELMEIREAYRQGEGNIDPIHQRYEALKTLIAANSAIPDAGYKLTYATQELAATREVLNDFGELTLDPADIQEVGAAPVKTTIYKIADQNIPWSAYWYPKRDNQLFNGDQAPLSKLDGYFMTNNIQSQSAQWEKDHFDPNAAEWEGLCDSWALASTMTREPTQIFVANGVYFSPSDLKAIAIKYFEGYGPKVYGRRYQGSASTDGQIQDLRPEAFHKLVEQIVGVQQKPLIVDEDPGPEVWSKPLFRMSFKFTRDPEFKDAVLVKAYPWMTRQRADVSDSPTNVVGDLAAPLYEYRLFHEPKVGVDGRYKVIAGEWIGASINFHPDMVYLPGSAVNGNQGNPELRKNHEEIRKLLVKAGMLDDAI